MKVEKWISYDEAENLPEAVGGMGGFFSAGMRWPDYLAHFVASTHAYFEALRQDIVARCLKQGGDWHQNDDEGAPVFDDGTHGSFSYRAWGDLMAAIWSTEENRDYGYMDFYMDCTMKKEDK